MSFIRKNYLSLLKLASSYLTGRNYPFVSVVRLNDACNMACSYCDSYKLSKSVEISPLITFLDQIYQKGCRFIILTGGEPFLYKDRAALMKWFQGKNIYLVINSNGKLIQNTDYQDFLKKADEVLISIDGPEEYNDSLRGHGAHKRVIETLQFLKTRGIKRTLSVVLTKSNSDEDNFAYLRDLKTKYETSIGFNPVTPDGRINNTEFSEINSVPKERLIALKNFIKLNRKIFLETPALLMDYFIAPSPFTCKTMRFALYVDVDHGIYPCINVTHRPEARFSDLESYNGKYQKKIQCQECSCTPLIMGNLMLQEKLPKPKYIFSILKRFW
jgi:sulfatase maturation enzyme AslB (radical SAM superfamily)